MATWKKLLTEDVIATSGSLGTSNTVVPSQGAVKTYVDSEVGGITTTTSLVNLTDTSIVGTPGDHEIIAYDSASSKFTNMTPAEANLIPVLGAGFTSNRALVTTASGNIGVSAVTDQEIGFLDGVTSNIQTQLNAKGDLKTVSFQVSTGNTTVSVQDGGDANGNATFSLAASGGITMGANNSTDLITIGTNDQLDDLAAMSTAQTEALAAVSSNSFDKIKGVGSSAYASNPTPSMSVDAFVINDAAAQNAGSLVLWTLQDVFDKFEGESWSFTNAVSMGSNLSVIGNATIAGNLTVQGTSTTINTETISLADNCILLNSNASGTPSVDAGIQVERGDSANKSLFWDESTNRWAVGHSETGAAGESSFTSDSNLATVVVTASATAPSGNSYGVGSLHMANGVPYIRIS